MNQKSAEEAVKGPLNIWKTSFCQIFFKWFLFCNFITSDPPPPKQVRVCPDETFMMEGSALASCSEDQHPVWRISILLYFVFCLIVKGLAFMSCHFLLLLWCLSFYGCKHVLVSKHVSLCKCDRIIVDMNVWVWQRKNGVVDFDAEELKLWTDLAPFKEMVDLIFHQLVLLFWNFNSFFK